MRRESGLNRRAGCLDQPFQQLVDLDFEVAQLAAEALFCRFGPGRLLVPRLAEHRLGKTVDAVARLDFPQNAFKSAFDDITADRLAVAHAGLVKAHIVRVLLARLALRPAGRQRTVAIIAGHEDT